MSNSKPREQKIVEAHKWHEISVSTDWGFERFYQCPVCGAMVRDKELHKDWHWKDYEVGR